MCLKKFEGVEPTEMESLGTNMVSFIEEKWGEIMRNKKAHGHYFKEVGVKPVNNENFYPAYKTKISISIHCHDGRMYITKQYDSVNGIPKKDELFITQFNEAA